MTRPRNAQINHGTNYGYQKCREGPDGTRCPECRAWNTERMQQYRAAPAGAGLHLAGLIAGLTRPASLAAPRSPQRTVPAPVMRSPAPIPQRRPTALTVRSPAPRTPAPAVSAGSKQVKAEIGRLAKLLGYSPAVVATWEGTPAEKRAKLEGLAKGLQLI